MRSFFSAPWPNARKQAAVPEGFRESARVTERTRAVPPLHVLPMGGNRGGTYIMARRSGLYFVAERMG